MLLAGRCSVLAIAQCRASQPDFGRGRTPSRATLVNVPSVLKHGKNPADCIKAKDELPLLCQHLLLSYADCKKGMVGDETVAAPDWPLLVETEDESNS